MNRRNTRDTGLSSGAGKGDAPRYKHDANWDEKFAQIKFPKSDEGFERVNAGRKRKHYGPRRPKKEPSRGYDFASGGYFT